jgi:hypothetical protein
LSQVSCDDRNEQSDDGRAPKTYMPNRWPRLNSSLSSNDEKLHVLMFGWFADGGLAYYCGDDDGDRGFEPEVTVYPDENERWSTDWPHEDQDEDAVDGRLTNIPNPFYDDLDNGRDPDGPSNSYDTQKYPDFAIMTPNARRFRYRRQYFERFRTNSGLSNVGTAVYSASSTKNASLADQKMFKLFCASKLYHEPSCKFTRDKTCLAYRRLSDPRADRRIDWARDGRDQPYCTPAQVPLN